MCPRSHSRNVWNSFPESDSRAHALDHFPKHASNLSVFSLPKEAHRAEMDFCLFSHLQQLSTKAALKVHLLKNLNLQIIFIHLTLFYRIKIRNQENQRYQGNIPCKDRHNKGQKWYGSNRSRRYILRRGGKNIQKNYTKKIFMTQITMIVWSLT